VATRLRPLRGALAVGLIVAGLVGGCGGAATPSPSVPLLTPPPSPAVETPMRSPSAEVAATAALVGQNLQTAGFGLHLFDRPARPSEPAELVDVPRAIYQVGLADPDGGLLVIYAFAASPEAAIGARHMADYVASPFGQTNYPTDAQFSVAQVNATVVFTWWAASRASDPAAAERAFNAIASVGQAVPVTK
jgi:hypothetical protein